MKLSIATDHAGYDFKEGLMAFLKQDGHEVVDLGTHDRSPCDYPDYAALLGAHVVSGKSALGILVCGSGIGMSIAANKVPGVRAAVVHDVTSAHLAREHNHANVLCLGSRVLGPVVAVEAVAAWLNATPGDGRHVTRIAKLDELDEHLVDDER